MLLKNIFTSLGLGILALAMLMSLFLSSDTFTFKYFLFIFSPLPILLSILSFSFWLALLSFLPLFALAFFDVSNLFDASVLYILPLFFVFIFVNFKGRLSSKHLPVILISYVILALIITDIILLKNHLSLPDEVLDFTDTIIFQIKSFDANVIPNNIDSMAKFGALILPSFVGFIFFSIMSINYVLANWLTNKYNQKYNLAIGYNLPNYYIYLFIAELIICLGVHYLIKDNWHISYVLYNIAILMFVLFLVPGFGVVSFIVSKNKIFLFLFILVFFVSSIYLIVILCLLGFLKEARVFKL